MHHLGSESQNGHYVTEINDRNASVMDDMTERSIDWLRGFDTAMPDIAAFCCVGVREPTTSHRRKKVRVREQIDAPEERRRTKRRRKQKRAGVEGVLRPRRVNLVNVGNSCYMNTMLFVFCHIPRIISFYDLGDDPCDEGPCDRRGHVKRVTARFIRYACRRLIITTSDNRTPACFRGEVISQDLLREARDAIVRWLPLTEQTVLQQQKDVEEVIRSFFQLVLQRRNPPPPRWSISSLLLTSCSFF